MSKPGNQILIIMMRQNKINVKFNVSPPFEESDPVHEKQK